MKNNLLYSSALLPTSSLMAHNTLEENNSTEHAPLLPLLIMVLFITVILAHLYLVMKQQRCKKEEQDRHENELKAEILQLKRVQLIQHLKLSLRKNQFLVEARSILDKMRNAEAKLLTNRMSNELKDLAYEQVFEPLFSEIETDFITQLKQKHPSLSHNDILTISFIRLELSTEEIALLSNVSATSANTNRYRLKKKLNLKKEDKLEQYIKNL